MTLVAAVPKNPTPKEETALSKNPTPKEVQLAALLKKNHLKEVQTESVTKNLLQGAVQIRSIGSDSVIINIRVQHRATSASSNEMVRLFKTNCMDQKDSSVFSSHFANCGV